jgi:hypothetical protein
MIAHFAETGDCQRVSTAQSKIGFSRNAVELLLGIAKCFGDCITVHRPWAAGDGPIMVVYLLIDVAGIVHFE